MMLLRTMRLNLSVASRILPASNKKLFSTIKVGDYDYLNDYVMAVLKECQTNEKPMPWKTITPNLINTLPISKDKLRGLNSLQVDMYVVTVLAMYKESKALLDFIVHRECEIF